MQLPILHPFVKNVNNVKKYICFTRNPVFHRDCLGNGYGNYSKCFEVLFIDFITEMHLKNAYSSFVVLCSLETNYELTLIC